MTCWCDYVVVDPPCFLIKRIRAEWSNSPRGRQPGKILGAMATAPTHIGYFRCARAGA